MSREQCKVFDFPLYYISFKRNLKLEKTFSKLGFKDINHFEAINGKKFTPLKLRSEGIITSRGYDDLIKGRNEWCGIPSLGMIGCTLSHASLWKKCVDENIPYMVILEEDVILKEKIDEKLCKLILDSVEKENGMFIGAKVEKSKSPSFIGLQFYVVSNGACKELTKGVFPIDVQTDCYVAELDFLKKINMSGSAISVQSDHQSSIQTSCPKCNKDYLLLKSLNMRMFLLLLLFILFILFIVSIYYYKKFNHCKISKK